MYFLQLDFVDKTCQQLGLLFCLDWNTWVLDYVDIVGACTNHLSVCMTLTYYETKGNFFSKFEEKKVWTEQVSESDSRHIRHVELWDQEFKTINVFSALLDKVDK